MYAGNKSGSQVFINEVIRGILICIDRHYMFIHSVSKTLQDWKHLKVQKDNDP